jgi:Uma2 family endonuclease
LTVPLPKENERYAYADYCTWDDGERWELIDGLAYAMAPSPGFAHQNISAMLLAQLLPFLRGKPCQAFHAPFDVRLNADNEDDTVVQPDILVVCDSSKLNEKGCTGAPDFVIEILSPSTARYDRIIKFESYRRAGVREYWIVDPDTRSLQACVMNENGLYVAMVYSDADTAPVAVLPGCEINLSDVFAQA